MNRAFGAAMVDPDVGARGSSKEVRESGSAPEGSPPGQLPPALAMILFAAVGFLLWREIMAGGG